MNTKYMEELGAKVFALAQDDEHVSLSLAGENSLFCRFNRSRVRQVGQVDQLKASLTYARNGRVLGAESDLSFALASDSSRLSATLLELREICGALPEDPYYCEPRPGKGTEEIHRGKFPSADELTEIVTSQADGCDLAGFYQAGPVFRGYLDSNGLRHWYEADTFSFDWSMYTADQKALKRQYAGREFSAESMSKALAESRQKLASLNAEPKTIEPGRYDVYLSPAAVNDLVGALYWGGFSKRSCQDRTSPLQQLYEGQQSFHTAVTLAVPPHNGYAPAFTEQGFHRTLGVTLVQGGKPGALLTSPRSGREFSVEHNAANEYEFPDYLEMGAGSLPGSAVLQTLGNGLYLDNLHYLNFSDGPKGRITGMTRFACFAVRDGVLSEPILKMRFDESIFRILGSQLTHLTAEREVLLDTSTYEQRQLGGGMFPGIIVRDFNLTL